MIHQKILSDLTFVCARYAWNSTFKLHAEGRFSNPLPEKLNGMITADLMLGKNYLQISWRFTLAVINTFNVL